MATPRIIKYSEARRKENMRISSTQDRARNKQKNEEAAKAIRQREAQKAAGINRIATKPLTPTTPTPLSAGKPGTITGEPAPYNPPGQSRFETLMHDQSAKGYNATNGYQMSGLSRGFYNKAHGIAETIRTGVQTEKFQNIPGSQVLGYPVRSTANLIEMGGMIPGGVETLADNPSVIVPALTVGAYQSTAGTVQAFKDDPLQTTSDVATGALLTGGAIKVAPKLTGAVGSSVKVISTNTKPIIQTTIKPAIKWTFADEIAFASKHTPTIKNMGNRVLFDAEMMKLQGKQGIDIAGSKLSQGTNRLTSKLPKDQVNQGINRVLFDAETVKLQQKNTLKKMLVEDSGEVGIYKQTSPELLIKPKIKTTARQTVKPSIQSKGFFNPVMFAPGVVSANMQIPSNKQRHDSLKVPDFAMDQLTVQIQSPVQIKIPVQKSVQIKDTVPKLTQKSMLIDSFGGAPKMPTLPKAAPKNNKLDIPDLTGWGKRNKSHYVADPRKLL